MSASAVIIEGINYAAIGCDASCARPDDAR